MKQRAERSEVQTITKAASLPIVSPKLFSVFFSDYFGMPIRYP